MDSFLYKDAINHLKAEGLFRSLRPTGPEPTGRPGHIQIEGRSVLLLASNNYLGLADHPRVREAAIEAIRRYGFGSGASRLISGNMPPFGLLENRIARFKGTEAALVFSTGYMANIGLLSSLLPSGGLLIADRLCHASLMDGCRLSGNRFRVYAHNDLEPLRRLLARKPSGQPAMIVTDGVFSMEGDIAPLPDLLKLAEAYGATVFVDDAHATGVIGKNGRGTTEHYGLDPQSVIQMGTLGKALGCFGAYVAGSRSLIDFLINKAKPLIYTTALPPAVPSAALAALDILEKEPGLRDRLWQNHKRYVGGLKKLGFNIMNSQTPIVPILIGDPERAVNLAQRLLEEGIYAPAIRPPTVPRGTSRIRTTVMAVHTLEDIEFALETMARSARSIGVI